LAHERLSLSRCYLPLNGFEKSMNCAQTLQAPNAARFRILKLIVILSMDKDASLICHIIMRKEIQASGIYVICLE